MCILAKTPDPDAFLKGMSVDQRGMAVFVNVATAFATILVQIDKEDVIGEYLNRLQLEAKTQHERNVVAMAWSTLAEAQELVKTKGG